MNETDKVVIAHIHPGDVSGSWAHSMLGLELFDLAHHQRLLNGSRFGLQANLAGAGQIPKSRNELAKIFLDVHEGADWLWFIDSDMGFEQDMLEQLLRAADKDKRPVVGGLCFGTRVVGVGECQAARLHVFPTIYRWVDTPDNFGFDPLYDYPKDALIRVAGTGAACLLIHRSVLEKIRAESGDVWFDVEPYRGGWFSEDLSFCRRVRSAGFEIHVDTRCRTSHKKSWWIDESFYDLLRRQSSGAKTYVVIPVKDQLSYTRKVVGQLVSEGGYEKILIFDNGSGAETKAWLAEQDAAEVFDAAGANLHEMWNAGIDQAQTEAPGSDVVILNNDLDLAPDFMHELTAALRSDPNLLAVSGNYDGRDFQGSVQQAHGICAGRYDGSGGFAGFAFAVRGEFAEKYRFPEDLQWWYGDNDMLATIETAGGWYGIAKKARVVHLDGGSVTARTVPAGEFDAATSRDRETFMRKWRAVEGDNAADQQPEPDFTVTEGDGGELFLAPVDARDHH